MVSVNLLPAEIAQKQATTRRARGWTLLVLGAVGAASVPVALNLTQQAQASGLARHCQTVQDSRTALQKELIGTVRECDVLDRRLARSETLRAKRPWAALIGFITACLPDEVWLTSLSTSAASRSPGPRRSAFAGQAGETGNGPIVLEAPTSLKLSGYAVDHAHLYTFMAQLKQHDVFAEVELLGAGVEPAAAGRAVRFELQCGW
jgi:Tfp pilus assembly protein PilN